MEDIHYPQASTLLSILIFGCVSGLLIGGVANIQIITENILFLSMTLILAILIFGWENHSLFSFRKNKTKIIKLRFIFLAVILILSVIIRVYSLGEPSMWFDEAISTVAAHGLLTSGTPTFPSGYTHWRAIPHHTLMAISMGILGYTDFAARLPSVFVWIVTSLFTYRLTRYHIQHRAAVLATAILAFSTWEIAWGRQARMYQTFQMFTVLTLYFTTKASLSLDHPQRSFGILIGLLGAVLTNTIGYALIPTTFAYLVLSEYNSGRSLRPVGFIIFTTTAVLGMFFVFTNTGVTGLLSGGGDVSRLLLSGQSNYLETYAEYFLSRFVVLIPLALGGIVIFSYTNPDSCLYFISIIVISIISLSVLVSLYAPRYFYFLFPLVAFFSACTLTAVGNISSRLVDNTQISPRLIFILFSVLLLAGGGFTHSPSANYDLGPNAPQPDFKSAYEYVNENKQPQDVIVAGWTAPGLRYTSQVDGWLRHDLTGIGRSWILNGRERFSGAEPLSNVSEIKSYTDRHQSGWIVVDSIAYRRQPADVRSYLERLDKHRTPSEEVTVYSW